MRQTEPIRANRDFELYEKNLLPNSDIRSLPYQFGIVSVTGITSRSRDRENGPRGLGKKHRGDDQETGFIRHPQHAVLTGRP